MRSIIQKVLPVVTATVFFVSTFLVAWWNTHVGFNKMMEQSPYIFVSVPNHWFRRKLETVRCPDKAGSGESATIQATVTNLGGDTDYRIAFWGDMFLQDDADPQQPLCEEIISIPSGKTAEASCTITVPQGDRLLTIVVRTSSDRATLSERWSGNDPASSQGMCRIIVGSFSTDYFSNTWIGLTLVGSMVGIMLWFLASRKTFQPPDLRTLATAIVAILVWVPAAGWGILHLEMHFVSWVAAFAPYLVLAVAMIWLPVYIRYMVGLVHTPLKQGKNDTPTD